MEVLSPRILLDNRGGSPIGQEHTESVTVRSRIGQERPGRRQRREQVGRRTDIAALAGCQIECDKPSVLIDNGMDFGRSSTPAAANRLRLGPPLWNGPPLSFIMIGRGNRRHGHEEGTDTRDRLRQE